MLQTIAIVALITVTILALVGITWSYYGVWNRKRLVDIRADVPVPFGADVSWLAVPSNDISKFCRALAAADDRIDHASVRPANWESGLARARGEFGDKEVFVTPPVDGWIFAANWEPHQERGVKVGTVLDRLSEEFGRATAFQNSDGETMWVLSENGSLRRGVIATRESWKAIGSPTVEERRVGIRAGRPVGTTRLLALAEAWSKDPSRVDQHGAPGIGRIVAYNTAPAA